MNRTAGLHRASRLWLTALVLALGAGTPITAGDSHTTGIDMVVLVDQSGSMWGHPQYHPEPNDRYDHRIGATRAVLERLAADVKDSERVHRFSVIDFGDKVEVAWSNQVLRHDPADPVALTRRLEVELPKRVVPREWVNTNTAAALAAALSELHKMEAAEALPGRRRVVLLITDGRPQLPPAGLDVMRERSRTQARELLAAGGELWVVGLNDSSNFWLGGDGAFWQELVGHPDRTHLAERAVPDLPRGVHRMVDDWLGVEPTPSLPGPDYVAPPYLGHLAFRVSFDKPSDPSTVTIEAPDGRVLARTSAGSAGSPSTYTRFALDDPPPGRYVYKSPGITLLVEPEPHPPAVYRLVPADTADLATDTRVVYQVKLGSGQPLEPLDAWKLDATVEVRAPDGSSMERPATFENEGKFTASWQPKVSGLHHLRLRGTTKIDGQTVDVFAAAAGAETTVEVSTARPVWLRLEQPEPVSGLFTSPWATRAAVRLALFEGDNDPVDARTLVANPNDWLRLERIDTSGVVLGEAQPLTVDDRGRFQTSIPIEPDWRGSPGLFGLGEIHLRVRAEAGRLPADRTLTAIDMPKGLEDRRVAGDPMSVGPIPLRLSRWLAITALASTLLLAGSSLALAATRLIPAWRISRGDGGRAIELRVYDLANDPAGAAAQKFPVAGVSSCKFDGQVQLTCGGETKVADRFRLIRLDVPGRPRARLTYRWRGEKRIQEAQLTAGSGPKILKIETAILGRPVAELVEV